jgi:proteasome lid subunit RPN8/RPN11
MLEYVGEWHSHPPGYAATPSDADRRAFAQLADLRRSDGLPPVMLIVGETLVFAWHIGEMDELGAATS